MIYIYINEVAVKPPCFSRGSIKEQKIMKAIAYSMDVLIPGLYVWFGSIKIRLGGSEPEENYPGVIHSMTGFAIVLPGYHIYSTYNESYDPVDSTH